MRHLITLLLSFIGFTVGAAVPVKAITDFHPEKYLGTWYEIARLPVFFERDCRAPIMAHYRFDPDDPHEIIVNNSCRKVDGRTSVATGVATFTQAPNMGQLQVSFLPNLLRWIPFTKGDYWVLYTDYSHLALVGAPNHEYLWVLSRTEQVTSAQLKLLIGLAQTQGFNTQHLVYNYALTDR